MASLLYGGGLYLLVSVDIPYSSLLMFSIEGGLVPVACSLLTVCAWGRKETRCVLNAPVEKGRACPGMLQNAFEDTRLKFEDDLFGMI